MDWGQFGSIAIGNTRRRLSFFVMVLCHSRMLYVQFTPAETMEHFLDCHVNAFSYFGGATARTMVDNLKCAVLQHSLGQTALLNLRYKDLAGHYGTEIAACGPFQPQEKGRVENAVAYVKKNFLAGRQITGLDSLNADVRQWLDTVANVRVHGTTHQKPVELFVAEKAALRPLPICLYDVAAVRPGRANSQFRVVVETNRYSVPAEHAGAPVTLKLYPGHVCVYRQDKLIARHVRSYDRHQDIEHPDHPGAAAATPQSRRPEAAATPAGPDAPGRGFYQALAERRLNVTHHVRKIVALSEIYGVDRPPGPSTTPWSSRPSVASTSPICWSSAAGCSPTRSVARDPPPGPAGTGTARARHERLRRRRLCPRAVEGNNVKGSTVQGSDVEGGQAQGHVADEVAKQQPTQMTLDFETRPPNESRPNVNPDPT